MNAPELMTLASNILAIVLVVGGASFAAAKVWPWFAERDATERERRHELNKQNATVAEVMATQLSVIAHSLTNPISVVTRSENGEDC